MFSRQHGCQICLAISKCLVLNFRVLKRVGKNNFCNLLNYAASVNGLPVVLTFRYDKVMNMSQATKFLGATGHGLAEGVFERAFGSIRIIEGMADAWKFIPKESVGKSLLRTAGYLPTTAGMESLSEGATQITQNMYRYFL